MIIDGIKNGEAVLTKTEEKGILKIKLADANLKRAAAIILLIGWQIVISVRKDGNAVWLRLR